MINRKHHSPWWLALFFVLFVVNIRVESDIAFGFERLVDGLVSVAVLFFSLYYAARFFGILPAKDGNTSEHE